MDRRDDPTISGDMILYRRIPPWKDNVTWDEMGQPTFSSANFKDRIQELSLHLAAETTPAEMLERHEGFGLIQMTAEQVRTICGSAVIICRCTEEPERGHVLVCGKITGGAARKLKEAARWVERYWPARNPPAPPTDPLEERQPLQEGGESTAPSL
jgi:hypothetical protein